MKVELELEECWEIQERLVVPVEELTLGQVGIKNLIPTNLPSSSHHQHSMGICNSCLGSRQKPQHQVLRAFACSHAG